MRPETYQLFALVCESILDEASTSLSMVQSRPGGKQVVQKLHQEKGLAHDQSYREIPKISWSELKDTRHGAWVIVNGSKGTGAIRASGGSYEAMASAGGEVQTFRNDRGGNILDFLKGIIGNFRSFHVGSDTGAVKNVKQKRASLNATQGPKAVSNDTLVEKFKPLWLRAMTAAQADIKGMVVNMIKNDAYEKAERKLGMLKKLDNAILSLDSGELEDAPDFVRAAVQTAVLMSASHYYPEETGEIQRQRWGSGGYEATGYYGPRKLLADIANGDTKKLGTILAFFKRSLISG